MYYWIAPDLKLLFAWNPKCACTTVKTAVLEALGHPIVGNVHNDMLTGENLKSGKFGIFNLRAFRMTYGFKHQEFMKFCIVRNPCARYVSAIRQRAQHLCRDEQFRTMTPADYLTFLESNHFGKDPHFHPQTKKLRKFPFDRVLDVSELHEFFGFLGLEYRGQRVGNHHTVYGDESPVRSASLEELTRLSSFPADIRLWLDDDGITRLRRIYAGDFEFARAHGHHYEMD